jgi:Uncharacterized conserved protein
MNLHFRPTFWPTVFTIPAVLLMLGLGVWQLERLQWKTAIIAERTQRTSAAPIPLPGARADVAGLEYDRVQVEGPISTTRRSTSAPAPSTAMPAIIW